MPMGSSSLQLDQIVATIDLLGLRIEERFPKSGLGTVCQNVLDIARNMEKRTDWITRPLIWLRVVTWLVVAVVILAVALPIVWALWSTENQGSIDVGGLPGWIQLIEAGINDLVLVGAAIFFLLTFETRYKRQRALKALHEIRSLAHVIDMHQLTKDPHRILGNIRYQSTRLSPKLEMNRFELHRYLDYCSEMLALLGKIAAVYVQDFDDGVTLTSAAEIETLTSGLSQKIGQKIAILLTVQSQTEPAKDDRPPADPSRSTEFLAPPAGSSVDAAAQATDYSDAQPD